MRGAVITLLLPLSLLAGCSDDGEPPAGDGAVPDQAAPSGARVGEACTAASDCVTHKGKPLECITLHNGVKWLGGYCSLPCDTSKPDCPGDSVCEHQPIYTALDEAHCFKTCTWDKDCRDRGYWCTFEGLCYPRANP